ADSVEQLRCRAARFDGCMHADQLDVTHPPSIRAVAQRITEEQGRIDVLVNNAGYGQPGAVEDLTRKEWLAQFDANVFGLVEVTRAVLPRMREQRCGRIINISSVVAHVVTPLMGAYGASKHAVDALSAALRMELAPWGLNVIVVEPGPIRTKFRANVDKAHFGTIDWDKSAYREHYRAFERHWREKLEQGGVSALRVAHAVRLAVESRRPKTCYRVTWVAHWAPVVSRLLGHRLSDLLMLRAFGLGKVAAPARIR
ncbi:MAG: SDR family NAD(P)-dependent oxidoreductase, partial [Phycisphaerae bacterium]|nr:SDR family NAD(P)-dependent oxidoreductase [Phycisphaerae bacterium]